jgi:hypothetical protein
MAIVLERTNEGLLFDIYIFYFRFLYSLRFSLRWRAASRWCCGIVGTDMARCVSDTGRGSKQTFSMYSSVT